MINIVFAGNYKVFDGLIIASLSIIKHCKEPINVYILTADLQEINAEYKPINNAHVAFLEELYKNVNLQSKVTLLDIKEIFMEEYKNSPNMDNFYTPYTLLRLFLDKIPNMPDKVLYLDTDVVAYGNVSELYNIDVTNYEVAGVPDNYGRWFFMDKTYFNAGVLLLNLEKLRKTKSLHKAMQLCATKKVFLSDQTAINKYCTKKLMLPKRFNEQKKEKPDTVIRHFAMRIKFFPYFKKQNIKPWHIDKLHGVLKIHTIDDILTDYQEIKQKNISEGV